MNTVFILMAQYGATAIVPIETVCKDYFPHLSREVLIRKINRGDIKIPVVRMEHSQKTTLGVHIMDLAAYIDKQRAAAIKEYETFHGRKWIAE
ncbi:Pyocin activator protein PrtN [Burkholderia sp. Bp8994]|uniref:pyocin activator PrtN family protein n=1 Tax=Burkholderia sp. Bp8994 TaxID=2184555 RepID=UPI000F5B828B|nr:pyocin activator PrtN family protein [Burkholderia sp. Bp8994]RQR94541.1 Pyocin activator protein PrtN [Burkholderia sp. Bp8994]